MIMPATVDDLPQPGRTLVMGVVNVTPDSFSDGGSWFEPDAAIAHGLELIAEGADMIDIGGESTRPGAKRPDTAEELRRVIPVVTALAQAGAVISVDTMRATVARQAIEAGARAINDVSGGLADAEMLATVAAYDVPYICMHWRGHGEDMQSRAEYGDVVTEVVAELSGQIESAVAAGISPRHLILDPGFGFAKTGEHNWEILQRLEEFEALGYPLVIGISRKNFLGTLLAERDANGEITKPRAAARRDDASMALTTLMASRPVWGVRVHTVRPNRDAIAVVQRLAARGE